jgi:hypothetical protein
VIGRHTRREPGRLWHSGPVTIEGHPHRTILVLCFALVLSACTGNTSPGGRQTEAQLSEAGDPVPQIAKKQSVDAKGGQIQTSGVEVVVPAGAVPAGQVFTVGTGEPLGDLPANKANETYGAPVQVEHSSDLAAPVHISWDVSNLSAEQRASLTLVRWDPDLGVWNPAQERPSLDGSTLSADVTQFSIMDWVSSGAAAISQTVGQLAGKRADAPKCSGAALPGWITSVVRPDADQPAMPVRTCTEPDKNEVLTVRVANNRPYTQLLDLTDGDKYAWTWAGEQDFTASGLIRDAVNALLSNDKTLVIAPTRAAAVGLARPAAPGTAQLKLTARPSVITVTEDILVYLLENGLGLDSVNGFDSATVNTLVQTVYDCGGKQVLKSRDPVSADTFRKVLDTVKSCAESDAVATAIEQAVRSQIAKGGATATRAIKTNRILKEGLSKLGLYLTVVDFASYTAELSSSGAIGDVTISVFGRGTPQPLGAWTATCTNADADSNALYKNLALQDAFADKNKEQWQFPTWQSSSITAAQPLTKCNVSQIESVAHNVETTWADRKAAAIVAVSIRALKGSSSATEVTNINIFSAGRVKAGYTITDEAGAPEDCTYDSGSPAGTTPNTHMCGTTASYMPACWADPSRANTVLCLTHGWDTILRRVRVTNLHPTPKVADPQPLSVELADGSRWMLRIGGSWDAVPTNYFGSYGCTENCGLHPNQVLVTDASSTFDTSKPLWTAFIARTGNTPETLSPPTRIAVARVWFIAAG